MHRRMWLAWTLGGIAFLLATAATLYTNWDVSEISGAVLGHGARLAGATVRVKTTSTEATTDTHGRFQLRGFPSSFQVHVTAWKDGYYIGGLTVYPWQKDIEINLERYQVTDNAAYRWIPPLVEERPALADFFTRMGLATAARVSFNRAFLPLSSRLALGCADCHGNTIYSQWASSAHAQGTDNIRFMTMYNGTDVSGRKSPPTRYGTSRDYGRFPLKPETGAPYYGPGFKLDFPDQAGNCAQCHAPTAALGQPNGVDMNSVKGIDAKGSQCDFCHKISEVILDPATQAPAENMPGVLSLRLNRPAGEAQVFFGPYDDVDVGPDTFLPLQAESRFCASCHNASFWGTPIYQSYAEWLASPYAIAGTSCQACHMKPDNKTRNFAPGRGGVDRQPNTVFTHAFPGAADIDLLQSTAKLDATARMSGGSVTVDVKVTNENGGHHIPTDSPMRNILLVVQAVDSAGNPLRQTSGPTVPEWGGIGTAANDYSGKPGKGYAKVLEELWTEVSPTAAYWRQTTILLDTRIAAKAVDVSTYEFRARPGDGPVTITVKLIYRRAFKLLAQQKGWDIPDIVMNQAKVTVP
ncbi:MAG: hypothetical protein HYY32_01845 [Chloroflexi bacterium]|nr:hypothetical protein [Chloroflexota bacterium]